MLLLDLHFEMPFGESKKKIKKKNFFNKFNWDISWSNDI
jgi:hypothetical protein